MSVSVTTVNGLVVVTQVFPQGEEMKIPITTPIAQAKTQTAQSSEPASPVSAMTRVFLQGQPKQLGIVQILIGILTMALGIILMFDNVFLMATPLCTGAFYILSGTFSVVAHRGTRAGLIRGTLALNILSALSAVAGVVVCCLVFIVTSSTENSCEEDPNRSRYNDNDYYWDCQRMFRKYKVAKNGVTGLLLVLAVFQFVVALTGAIFAGKASRSSSTKQPAVVVIEKPDLRDGDVDSLYGSDVGLLDSGSDAPDNPTSDPPAYDV
ncbi:hypothetical protein AAFF_G00170150 [Aldrovandia affinis]|uniref:Uncharacterized protein n=1 Tax=Aldrovandia affinis TaxID=143900 RepID=A0AAD7RM04_9TELE|nr:hypothetical protein AAFF_G00170150 [Aldrovandia affinis]